jgi:hypothetical protein
VRVRTALGILAAGWIVVVLYAYPGVMTMDSFDQLGEGRAWFFTDSHPPVMAALWGLVDRVIPGALGMLLIQVTALFAGLYLVLRRALHPVAAAIVSCVIALFPPVLTPMAVMWKDSQMVGPLLLGVAWVVSPRRWVRVAGLVALAWATALRYNAPAATLPLVVLLFEWQPGRRWLVRYAIAIAAWIAITAAGFGCDAMLVDQPMHFWYSSLAVEDLVGTLAHVEPDLPDSELGPVLAPTGILIDRDYHARLRAKYEPYEFVPLISGDGRLWNLPIAGKTPAPEPIRNAIGHAWSAIVLGHPLAYAEYRIEAFGELLSLGERRPTGMVIVHRGQYAGMLASLHLTSHATPIARVGEKIVTAISKHTPLYRPFVYFVLALALLWPARRHRDVLALLVSGLLMELSLLPLVQTPDYRYSHWLVICSCVAASVLFVRRTRDIAAARA